MRDIHDHNEYHKYKSTTNGSGVGFRISGPGWIIIIIVVIFLISFISDGASWEAIETLLALGFILYLFFK